MSTAETHPQAEPTFADLGLPESVAKALEDKGYESPTPVQVAAFAPASNGKDLVVQARTGTGKTAAFGLPLISSRVRPDNQQVQALVLCPTRELALQVKRELEALARYSEIRVVALYGGAPMGKQIEELQHGAHVVVGTPGRVLDHLSRKSLDVQALRCFILDECDEMLSMGFLPQINDVWEQLPKGHQTLLFSATVPPAVSRIADTRLRDAAYITLSGDHIGALEIEHYFYLSQGDKAGELSQVIELEQPESAIVFCNTREASKRVAKRLQDAGYDADWLNADLSQNEREQVMRRTRDSELRFLICTDVAARGIDISHLTHVINFDFPESADQYIHRTGRTGRAGRTGTAISFVEPTSIGDLYYLRLRYKVQPIERQLPSARELRNREEADVLSLLALRLPTIEPTDSFYSLARRLLTHDQVESVVAGLLKEHLGSRARAEEQAGSARRTGRLRPRQAADAAPPAREHAPRQAASRKRSTAEPSNASNGAPKTTASRRTRTGGRRSRRQQFEEEGIAYEVSDAENGEPSQTDQAKSPNPFVSLYINVGKRDGAETRDLKEALSAAGIRADETGKITVKQNHSFVEVSPDRHELAISKLTGRNVCGREMQVEVARKSGG